MDSAPGSLIIFGFTGDLSKRKLLPSLYNLELAGKLADDFQVIGVTRRAVDMAEYKNIISENITASGKTVDTKTLDTLCGRISIAEADVSAGDGFNQLKEILEELLPQNCATKLFYFAVPPSMFESIIKGVVQSKINQCGGSSASRMLIEKPFGHSLKSAQELIQTIEPDFAEYSIYRIDHYLAKDTAQNILHFRFHNPIARSLWETGTISSIQVSALEFIDIQGRADFYEQTGALRDMIQGHLLQLLALVTMDEPASLSAEDVRRQRQLLLQSIKPIDTDLTARGQYEGYKDEVGKTDTNIETYAAIGLEIDSTRWRGVPIYLQAGKAMETKFTEVNIIFKSNKNAGEQNVITFRLQPSEGIAVRLVTKKPGLEDETEEITLDYCYDGAGGELSDAYDRILYDGLRGDQTLFPTDKEILNNWALVQPIIDAWAESDGDLEIYPKGTAGILASTDMLARKGDSWTVNETWVCSPKR